MGSSKDTDIGPCRPARCLGRIFGKTSLGFLHRLGESDLLVGGFFGGVCAEDFMDLRTVVDPNSRDDLGVEDTGVEIKPLCRLFDLGGSAVCRALARALEYEVGYGG